MFKAPTLMLQWVQNPRSTTCLLVSLSWWFAWSLIYLECFTHKDIFLTLWIFWGLTVGHLSQAELLIIMAELCVETPKQRSAAKRTSFCSQSLFFLFTLTKRRESPSMLSLSEAKTSVWISTEGTEAVTYHRRWPTTQHKYSNTCTHADQKPPKADLL